MSGGGTTLEYTATWVVAVVCSVIVVISLLVERSLHSLGKYFKKKGNKPLYEALQKVKEELMLMGFISLLLTVSQTWINKICIPKKWAETWLPCSKRGVDHARDESEPQPPPFHVSPSRYLLLEAEHPDPDPDPSAAYCTSKGKVPLLSITALHHLHTFIFVLAFVHVVFCALTILFGSAKIRKWKWWEESAMRMESDEVMKNNVANVKNIRNRLGSGSMLGWLHSFFKQFFGSVTKSDYLTLRLGFIKNHCPANPKFDFHKYMMRCLEADFKKVVGISWYLWLFVLVFLLMNVNGWHAYFYLAFIPFVLLLAVGTKLEHVITELAEEVAEKQVAVEGDLVVRPSDEHFWFGRPKIVVFLIHVLLFQNSFELAFLLFILLEYRFDSCIMGAVGYVIPRFIIGAFVQFLCSYSTLPLYAIVTQMGSSFKKEIFDEDIQKGLQGWLRQAKGKGKGFRRIASSSGSSQTSPLPLLAQDANDDRPPTFQLTKLQRKDSLSKGTSPLLARDADDDPHPTFQLSKLQRKDSLSKGTRPLLAQYADDDPPPTFQLGMLQRKDSLSKGTSPLLARDADDDPTPMFQLSKLQRKGSMCKALATVQESASESDPHELRWERK